MIPCHKSLFHSLMVFGVFLQIPYLCIKDVVLIVRQFTLLIHVAKQIWGEIAGTTVDLAASDIGLILFIFYFCTWKQYLYTHRRHAGSRIDPHRLGHSLEILFGCHRLLIGVLITWFVRGKNSPASLCPHRIYVINEDGRETKSGSKQRTPMERISR